jgi:hypothetical protein
LLCKTPLISAGVLQMPVVIGGEKAWLNRVSGDIGIAYHWINDEPAMCLFPVRKRISTAGAFIICMSAAYKYVNPNGHPNLNYMVTAAADAADTMGFSSKDTFIIRKIIDVIADGMGDLLAMPPEPKDLIEKAVRENVGEMTLTCDGEKIAERELTALDADELKGVH